MKQIPLPCSTPMVQAIGDDRKTVTRRTRGLDKINEAPDDWSLSWCGDTVIDHDLNKIEFGAMFKHNKRPKVLFIKSPYGQPGDLLWVRETWARSFATEAFHGRGVDSGYIYAADYTDPGKGCWKPSIHMPKAAARYWLKVKSVRSERIQSITEEDAIAEGVKKMIFMTGEHVGWQNYSKRIKEPFLNKPSARESFQSLIVSINGHEIWDMNKWVCLGPIKLPKKGRRHQNSFNFFDVKTDATFLSHYASNSGVPPLESPVW